MITINTLVLKGNDRRYIAFTDNRNSGETL